jgi:YVTN family beta-propeller protein
MLFATAAPCYRPRRSCLTWFVWACLGLVALLTGVPAAQAQPAVYVLSHGPVSGNSVPQYLTVIDGATNQKGPRIQLGLASGLTASMAIAPDGERIYVTNDRDMTVSVVSTATNTVIQTLPKELFLGPGVLQSPVQYVVVSPDSQTLYVNVGTGISVIDTASMMRINYRGGIYGQPVISPDGTRLYFKIAGGYSGPDRVLVLDAASLVTLADVSLPAPTADRGYDISITPDGRYVHITRGRYNNASGLAVLDTTTNTIVHERPTPNAFAAASETSPNGAYLYVVGRQPSDQLYRLSPTTHLELSTTSGVGNAYDLAFSADSARAYVAASNRVYVIDTATHSIDTTIPFFSTDGSPRSVAVLGAGPIDPTPSNLRVTSIVGNRVSLAWNQPANGPADGYVIEGGPTPGSVFGSVPTGSPATSFTFDAPTGAFYIRVHALTSSGRSPASNEIQIFVNVPRPPSAPADLLGLADGSTIALSWRNTLDGGTPTGLILDVSGALAASIPLPLGEAFEFSDVPAGTYQLRIRAVNETGTSPASAPITLTFPGACPGPPQMPRNVVVQRAGSLVSVAWDPPSAGPAATSYVLNVTGDLNLTMPLDTRRVAGDVPSGTYNLWVLSVNACGASAGTVPQSVTVP